MKKYFVSIIVSLALLSAANFSFATVIPPGPAPMPTDAGDCKKGGWMNYGNAFKNQGDCVSFVVTGGKNLPSGI